MIHSALLLVLTAAALAQVDVQLRTLEGKSVAGPLAALNDRQVTLLIGGKEQSFAPGQLHTLGFNEKAKPARWQVQVTLTDGSTLNAASYAAAQGKATIVLSDETSLRIPLSTVATVRLRDQSSAALAKQWAEYLAEAATADRIVIRRKLAEGGSTAESLDIMEGVLGDVTEALVNFEVEGDPLEVKRPRIEGLLYFRGRAAALPPAMCIVVDIDDSRWSARTLELSSDELQLTTPAGTKHSLPLARIRRLDYAAANRRYLTDLPRDSLLRETWLDGAAEPALGVFSPLTGRTPEGPISMGGEPHPQALWMPAKSALIVRVPEGFSRFQAQVGIDDRVGTTDGARLLLEADGKVLFDEVLQRESALRRLDVDLAGARRVRITVDYGGQSFVGDQLVLSEAMFVRNNE